MYTQEDIEQIYTYDEAQRIADAWTELTRMIACYGLHEGILDALNIDTLDAFAQMCSDHRDLEAQEVHALQMLYDDAFSGAEESKAE